MNGSAHSAASVTDITLKRGPAGKFGSLLDFSGTVGAVETEFSPAVRFCATGSARFNNKWRADLTGAVNPNGKSDDFHYTRVRRVDRIYSETFLLLWKRKFRTSSIHHQRYGPTYTDPFLSDSGTLCLADVEVFQVLWVWIWAGSEGWQSQLPVDFD